MQAKRPRRQIAAAAAILVPMSAIAYSPCGELSNSYGPYDFRTEQYGKLKIVTKHHFTAGVETLTKRETDTFGGDLDYTLRASPNYHRSLQTLAKLSDKLATDRPPGTHWPVECYFERAIRFAPDDPMARVLYAAFLEKRKRKSEARQQLEAAEAEETPDSNLLYNMGLIYLRIGDIDAAASKAKAAYALGFPLPGLRNLLAKKGVSITDDPSPNKLSE